MKIDRDKLQSLDEKALGELIEKVVRAMGLGEARARRMAQNAPMIRMMLLRASDRDLERIVSAVGDEKASELLSSLEKKT
ncbi:MAG: hypothetical protein IKC63_02475 [Clostridia bacterium]|nr:hypothetical protein [Clostridia bacterium]